jgi:hypothetical protein
MNLDPAHLLDPSLLPQLLKRERDDLRWLWTIATSEVQRHRSEKFSHFVKMDTINIAEIEAELDQTPDEFWGYSSVRKDISVLRNSDRISLRGLRYTNLDGVAPNMGLHVHEDGETARAKFYPKTMALIRAFAEKMNSIPSRAVLARLEPNDQVYAHFDIGFYYLVRDRYHLVIKSPKGSRMRCLDQMAIWKPGELWWFNNKVQHEAFNQDNSWRTHLIFDLLPKHLIPLMERIKSFTPYYQDIRAIEQAGGNTAFSEYSETIDPAIIESLRTEIMDLSTKGPPS